MVQLGRKNVSLYFEWLFQPTYFNHSKNGVMPVFECSTKLDHFIQKKNIFMSPFMYKTVLLSEPFEKRYRNRMLLDH
jgi:hypothetical protein